MIVAQRSVIEQNKEKIDPEEILNTLDKLTELLRAESRLNVLFYLLIHKELSFTELADLLGKPKSSLHHHIEKLVKDNIVRKTRKEGQKDIFYTIDLAPLREIGDIVTEDIVDSLTSDKVLEAIRIIYSFTKAVYPILRNSIDLAENYIDKRQEEYEVDGADIKQLMKSHDEHNFSIVMGFMSEERFANYKENYSEFIKKSVLQREQECECQEDQIDEATPYLVCHLTFPLRKMLEYQKKTTN